MEKNIILTEISSSEKKLLDLSKKVLTASGYDSMDNWIAYILVRDPELCKHLSIPIEKETKKAILKLVTVNSSLKHPIVNLLTNRIVAYIEAIGDLKNHPLKGDTIDMALENFEPLIELSKNYNSHFEAQKNIELIYDALKENKLYLFKSSQNEPDIRIILKTFKSDLSRDHKEACNYILNFIFSQLKQNLKQNIFSSHPRHAWWGLLDLLTESETTWRNEHLKDLTDILNGLLDMIDNINISQNLSSLDPELNSTFYEKVWVTINAIKIYKRYAYKYFDNDTSQLLLSKIEINLKVIINNQNINNSLRNIQCKLVLLYEALSYKNYINVQELMSRNEINISSNKIGELLYDDKVIANFLPIKSGIQRLINDRESWKKHTLSAMLLSGVAGQGKSEMIKQILFEINKMCEVIEKKIDIQSYAIGTHIKSTEDLSEILRQIKNKYDSDAVRVVIFDEYDKADFDFPTPFLVSLESEISSNEPLTFWLFVQSTYATGELLKSYASTLKKKSLRDFLTRIQLGFLDLSQLKASPQQRIYTTIGLGLKDNSNLTSISSNCLRNFAENETLLNIRDLIKVFSDYTEDVDNKLQLKNTYGSNQIESNVPEKWISIIKN